MRKGTESGLNAGYGGKEARVLTILLAEDSFGMKSSPFLVLPFHEWESSRP